MRDRDTPSIPRNQLSHAEAILIGVSALISLSVFVAAVLDGAPEKSVHEVTDSPRSEDFEGDSILYTIPPQNMPAIIQGSYEYVISTSAAYPITYRGGFNEFFPAAAATGEVAAIFRDQEGTFSVQLLGADKQLLFERSMEGESVNTVAVSNDRKIAFAFVPDTVTSEEALSVTPWRIRTVDTVHGSIDEFSGLSPAYLSSGELMYLGTDGIYVRSPEKGIERIEELNSIFGETSISTATQLVAASNVPRFALIDLNSGMDGTTRIYQMEMGHPVLLRTFPGFAQHGALSPNGEYIALQIRSASEGRLPGAGTIEIYDIKGGQLIHSIDLGEYTPSIHLTALVERM